MTDNNHTETRLLLEKFLNGSSTLKEERRLYALFRDKNLPDDLKQYSDMIAWFSNRLCEKQPAKKQRPAMIWIKIATGIAVAAIISVVTYTTVCHNNNRILEETYAGSFITRNGTKITDLSIILPEIERAEKHADEIDRKIEMEIAQMEKIFNNQ